MIAANGGMASATTETTTAAVAEYLSRTAQDKTNRPMQTDMSMKYSRRSDRDGGCPADPSGSCPSSKASAVPSRPDDPPHQAMPVPRGAKLTHP